MKIRFWFPWLWEHFLKQEASQEVLEARSPDSVIPPPLSELRHLWSLKSEQVICWWPGHDFQSVILFTYLQREGFGSAPLRGMFGFQIYRLLLPSLCALLRFIPPGPDQTLPFHDSFLKLLEEFTRLCSFLFVCVPVLHVYTHMCAYPCCVHRQNLKLIFYLFCRHSPPYIWDSLLWRLNCLPSDL